MSSFNVFGTGVPGGHQGMKRGMHMQGILSSSQIASHFDLTSMSPVDPEAAYSSMRL